MEELDKPAMGKRIRQIRLGRNLKQWELARRLGTTQSAVHKYERGVVPEPRRLVELARIGGTSIEWIVTGRHWENGSTTQGRLPGDVLATACLLREVSAEARERLEEALGIIREAVRSMNGPNAGGEPPAKGVVQQNLKDHSTETLRLLETAWRIQRAILQRIARDTEKRLETDGG